MKKYSRFLVLTLVMMFALGVTFVYAYSVLPTNIWGKAIKVDKDGIEWKAVSNTGYNKVTSDIILENATTKGASNATPYVYYGMEYTYDSGLVWNEYYKRWNAFVNVNSSFVKSGNRTWYTSTEAAVGDGYTTYLDATKPYIPKGNNAYIISGVENNKITYTLYDTGTTAVPLWRKVWVISIPVNSLTGIEQMTQMATIVLLDDNYNGVYNKGVTFDRVNVYKGTVQSAWTNSNTIYGIAKGTTTNTTVTYQNPNGNYSKVTVDVVAN